MSRKENPEKKLYRSSKDKMFLGVFGGLGEYLHVKPNILRSVYAIVAVFTGVLPCLVLYLIMGMIIPADPHSSSWSNFFRSVNDQVNQMGHQFHHQGQKPGRRELHDVKVKDVHDSEIDDHH